MAFSSLAGIQSDGTIFFKLAYGSSLPNLLHKPTDDLYTGQVTFVNSSIKSLPGKGFAM